MDDHRASRRQLVDTTEYSAWRDRRPKCEELVKPNEINRASNLGTRQQGLDLRSKEELPVQACIVERPDPETITRQKQPLPWSVPNREGPLAVEPFYTTLPFLLVQTEQDFRIRTRYEPMPLRNQFVAEFNVVKNLPIERNHQSILRDRHRLMAARHINDTQPGVSKTDRTMTINTRIIRTSVTDGPNHLTQSFPVDRSAIDLKAAGYPAHLSTSPRATATMPSHSLRLPKPSAQSSRHPIERPDREGLQRTR